MTRPAVGTLMIAMGLAGILLLASAATLATDAISPLIFGSPVGGETGSIGLTSLYYQILPTFLQNETITPNRAVLLNVTSPLPLKAYLLDTTVVDFHTWLQSVGARVPSPMTAFDGGNLSLLNAYIAAHGGQVLGVWDVGNGTQTRLYVSSSTHPLMLVLANPTGQRLQVPEENWAYTLRISPSVAELVSAAAGVIGLALVAAWAFMKIRKRGHRVDQEQEGASGALVPSSALSPHGLDQTLGEIVATCQGWYGFLKRRSIYDGVGSAAFTAALVLFFAYALWSSIGAPLSLLGGSPLAFSSVGIIMLLGSIGVGVVFYLHRRRKGYRFSELLALTARMKGADRGKSLLEDSLLLIDGMFKALPEIKRERLADAWRFAAIIGIVTLFVSLNLVIALAFGLISWLFLRFEFLRVYKSDTLRFEKLRRAFDQEKDAFLQSL